MPRLGEVWPGKNRFWCGYRGVGGPDRGALIATVLMLVLPGAVFFALPAADLAQRTNAAALAVPLLFFATALAALARTATMDPGIVPRYTGADPEYSFDPARPHAPRARDIVLLRWAEPGGHPPPLGSAAASAAASVSGSAGSAPGLPARLASAEAASAAAGSALGLPAGLASAEAASAAGADARRRNPSDGVVGVPAAGGTVGSAGTTSTSGTGTTGSGTGGSSGTGTGSGTTTSSSSASAARNAAAAAGVSAGASASTGAAAGSASASAAAGGSVLSVPVAASVPLPPELVAARPPITQKWCDTCRIYRPPRVTHCSICDCCIYRMDRGWLWALRLFFFLFCFVFFFVSFFLVISQTVGRSIDTDELKIYII
jgi:hypothetical protein